MKGKNQESAEPLRVGEIPYLNMVPIFTALKEYFNTEGIRFIKEHPREINKMLREGEIDISPSSSIEYAKYPDRYLLIPDISVSSREKVLSVLLFSPFPLEKNDVPLIYTTVHSDSSFILTKIVMTLFMGKKTDVTPLKNARKEGKARGVTYLLIGDEAIMESMKGKDEKNTHVYDLGELWNRYTGLPFPFALWMVNRERFEKDRRIIKKFCRKLLDAKKIAGNIVRYGDRKIAVRKELSWGFLNHYWSNLSYELDVERAGLELFFTLSREIGEIEKAPSLNFIDLP